MATKKPGKALVKWDEEFKGYAKDATKGMELPSSKFLSIKGGRLKFDGADVPGNELECVIVGWVYENQFYDSAFDPDNSVPPVCYAFGSDQDEMAPHENVKEPINDSCADCPYNQWESDLAGGKGKACKNVIRLALIADSDLESLDEAEIVYLKIPVTQVKNFMVYARKKLAETAQRPYWSVVTKIHVEQDDRTAVKVTFDLEALIEDSDLFAPLKELWEKAMEGIDFPYPEAKEREQPKRGGKGRGKPAPAPKAAKFGRQKR